MSANRKAEALAKATAQIQLYEAQEKYREATAAIGREQARMAASGLKPGSGSALYIMLDLERQQADARHVLDVAERACALLNEEADQEERPPRNRKAHGKSRARKPGGGRPPKYDWEEGRLFAEKLFGKKGDPTDKANHLEGWRSITDMAVEVQAHLKRHDPRAGEPDLSKVRDKVSVWLTEFRSELAQN
jgi:hypothetical protein